MPDCGRKKLRVLIADDSAAMRDRIASLISNLPAVEIVGVARDGQEALDQSRALCPDVLILDLRMPKLNGFDVVKGLRRDENRLFVVILTNQTEPVYCDRAFAAGANSFLSKATQINDLDMVIRELALNRAQ